MLRGSVFSVSLWAIVLVFTFFLFPKRHSWWVGNIGTYFVSHCSWSLLLCAFFFFHPPSPDSPLWGGQGGRERGGESLNLVSLFFFQFFVSSLLAAAFFFLLVLPFATLYPMVLSPVTKQERKNIEERVRDPWISSFLFLIWAELLTNCNQPLWMSNNHLPRLLGP